MDAWLYIVIRQFTLYLLPILISLTFVCWVESYFTRKPIPHPFYSISYKATWYPFLVSIFLTRGVIFALPQSLKTGLKASFTRFLAHLILTLIGFLLYTWALQHQNTGGLPPLHHWWAKVFMYFNLCMLAIHCLPLPHLCMGEFLIKQQNKNTYLKHYVRWMTQARFLWLVTLLAASPLLDILLGSYLIFPIYEQLASLATIAP